MLMFLTMYSDKDRKPTPNGNRIQTEYEYKRNKSGSKYLGVKGEFDQHEKIQEYLEDCKIENILRRVTAGDTTVLRPQGMFMDTTIMPHNMIEMQQHIQNLENFWGELPIDIKRKYDFDLDKFIGASGTDQWMEDMGYKQTATEAIKTASETAAATAPSQSTEETT